MFICTCKKIYIAQLIQVFQTIIYHDKRHLEYFSSLRIEINKLL